MIKNKFYTLFLGIVLAVMSILGSNSISDAHAALQCENGKTILISSSSQNFFTEKENQLKILREKLNSHDKLLLASNRDVRKSLTLCTKNNVSPCKTAEIKRWGEGWGKNMSRKLYAQIIALEEKIKEEKNALCSASPPGITSMSED